MLLMMEYTMEDWQCNQEYDWPSVDDYQMLNYDRLERQREGGIRSMRNSRLLSWKLIERE